MIELSHLHCPSVSMLLLLAYHMSKIIDGACADSISVEFGFVSTIPSNELDALCSLKVHDSEWEPRASFCLSGWYTVAQ